MGENSVIDQQEAESFQGYEVLSSAFGPHCGTQILFSANDPVAAASQLFLR